MSTEMAGRLTLRDLNRATLARQHLLERTDRTALEVIEDLAGMQSQAPAAPFIGLWSRIAAFRFDELSRLMVTKEAVRILTMRGTVHLLSARDALGLEPHFQPVFEREFRVVRAKKLAAVGIDPDLVEARARELVGVRPMTAREIAEVVMAEHPDWPEEVREHVAAVPRIRLPLVQLPPRGTWGGSGQATYRLIEDWLEAERDPYPIREVVRRYLAAFGPATVKDAQTWSGLTRLAPVFDELGDDLVAFEGPAGERLHDLPGAPRPGGDVPAPLRILPEFDNLLVSFADRARVIDEPRRKAMATLNGMVPGTVLVDGRVEALAKTAVGKGKQPGRIRIMPLATMSTRLMRDLEDEAGALLEAMGDRWAGGAVTFEDPGERWRPNG